MVLKSNIKEALHSHTVTLADYMYGGHSTKPSSSGDQFRAYKITANELNSRFSKKWLLPLY